MKKTIKKIGIVIGCIVAVFAVLIVIMYQMMNQKTTEALAKQTNVDIDMSKVQDGTFSGSSDGGMVYVEVEVTVKNHTIESIDLIKHQTAKGKPAESMIDVMIAKNTYKVDTVSGATTSSKTIENAVNTALQKGLN